MYTLDGHNLEDYGFLPAQSDNSNLAIAGAWDMPSRSGKTYHEWYDCIEPYLREDEIFFNGRDIYYNFLVKSNSKQQAMEKVYSFYDLLSSFDELKPFASELGTFEVYVKSEIRVEYLDNGWCKGIMVFREPVADMAGDTIVGNDLTPNIDGISFPQFGITLKNSDGEFNRPAIKDGKMTVYGREGFSVTQQSFRMINLSFAIAQPTYAAFNDAIKSFATLLSAPNARILTLGGIVRECFAKDGFKVTNVNQQGNGFIGLIELSLCEIRVLTDYNLLSDSNGNILTDGNGVPLSQIFKQQ